MNNNYYQQPLNYEPNYKASNLNRENNTNTTQYAYIYAFLKSKVGSNAKIFMSFPDSIEWRDKIFEGKIISVGNDYVLIKDNKGIDSLLTNIYINYIEFI